LPPLADHVESSRKDTIQQVAQLDESKKDGGDDEGSLAVPGDQEKRGEDDRDRHAGQRHGLHEDESPTLRRCLICVFVRVHLFPAVLGTVPGRPMGS